MRNQQATKEMNISDIEVISLDQTISSVIHHYEIGEIVIDVDCQRGFVWDRKRSSRLVESILMGLPIPIFYCFDSENASELIDGKQRFLSIHKFLSNEYSLKNLEVYSDLNGKYFKDLPAKIQRTLRNYPLHVYKITSDCEESKYEIFNRLNTGGAKLTLDELVLGMHEGPITEFARDVASELIASNVVPETRNKHKKIDFRVLTSLLYTQEALISPLGKNRKLEIAAIFKDDTWKERLTESSVNEYAGLLATCYKLGRSIHSLVWPDDNRGVSKRDNMSLHVMLVYILSRLPVHLREDKRTLDLVEGLICDAFIDSDELIRSCQVKTQTKDNRMLRQSVADSVISSITATE